MPTPPKITVQGRASIAGAPLFDQINLQLAPGCWTCLLGGSGTGKSTLLRLIAGLETGTDFTGTITASDGAPVASRTAFMAQDDLLLPWANVRENLALGAKLRGTAVDHARRGALLRQVGLEAHAARRPPALSGGQKQRAALARTLMEDKPIVLLDEPFSALDARTRSQMQELAARLLHGKTVLLVTHDPGEAARLGDQILVLSPDGLEPISPPQAPIPRDEDAPETLACMGRLMRLLKREPTCAR